MSKSKATSIPRVTGRVCIIRDRKGSLIDNIDTDMIFHNAHLHITDISQMGQYAFGNLPGWQHFPEIASDYDILVVGRNFGAGSSRQQAVDCFRALGIEAILAQSFAPIYLRNAVNSGMVIQWFENAEPDARGILEGLEDRSEVSMDPEGGRILIEMGKTTTIKSKPVPPVLMSIINAGGLFEYAKTTS